MVYNSYFKVIFFPFRVFFFFYYLLSLLFLLLLCCVNFLRGPIIPQSSNPSRGLVSDWISLIRLGSRPGLVFFGRFRMGWAGLLVFSSKHQRQKQDRKVYSEKNRILPLKIIFITCYWKWKTKVHANHFAFHDQL